MEGGVQFETCFSGFAAIVAEGCSNVKPVCPPRLCRTAALRLTFVGALLDEVGFRHLGALTNIQGVFGCAPSVRFHETSSLDVTL